MRLFTKIFSGKIFVTTGKYRRCRGTACCALRQCHRSSKVLMRLIAEIRNRFTVELSIREVIEHPQLNDLAQRIFETSLKSVLTIKPDYQMGTDEMEITI